MYSSSNINEIENNLNTALGRIYDWCVRNKLTINAKKTKSMLIGSKQKVCNTDLNVSIAGSSVVQVNYVKLAGLPGFSRDSSSTILSISAFYF